MRQRIRRGLVMLATLVAGAGALPARAAAPAVGDLAPSLVAPLFGGSSFDLAGQRGHVVLLNFWASWCKPCRAEMPELARLQRQYRERGLVVLGLSADDRHDLADARKAAQGLDYALGMLGDATVNGFGQPLGIPLIYLVGADGAIRAILRGNQGPLDAAALETAVTGVLDSDVR